MTYRVQARGSSRLAIGNNGGATRYRGAAVQVLHRPPFFNLAELGYLSLFTVQYRTIGLYWISILQVQLFTGILRQRNNWAYIDVSKNNNGASSLIYLALVHGRRILLVSFRRKDQKYLHQGSTASDRRGTILRNTSVLRQ